MWTMLKAPYFFTEKFFRTLQLILAKVSLLLGVQIERNIQVRCFHSLYQGQFWTFG